MLQEGGEMLKKLCKCGKRIPITEKQCEDCRRKQQKSYDTYKRENRDIYRDRRWAVVRAMAKEDSNGIDLYHLYRTGRIVEGTLGHHIVEVKEDRSLAFDPENVFWLTDGSHKEVHALYERSAEDKKATQDLLHRLKKAYKVGQ